MPLFLTIVGDLRKRIRYNWGTHVVLQFRFLQPAMQNWKLSNNQYLYKDILQKFVETFPQSSDPDFPFKCTLCRKSSFLIVSSCWKLLGVVFQLKNIILHNCKKMFFSDNSPKMKNYRLRYVYVMNMSFGVNFINILLAPFLYESALSSFSLLHFGFVIFSAQGY